MRRDHLGGEHALEILDTLGCSDDPVYVRGIETSPHDLLDGATFDNGDIVNREARKTTVIFWGIMNRSRRGGWLRGSLLDMVLERMGAKHAAKRCKLPRCRQPDKCHCGCECCRNCKNCPNRSHR